MIYSPPKGRREARGPKNFLGGGVLALTIALRELRGGIRDFKLFLGCLIIGVAVIAAVNSISRHIESGIRQESKTLLGGDVELTLTNERATPEQWDFLHLYGKVSLTANLRAMAINGDNTALVELKGVDDAYPLLGEMKLSSGHSLHDALSQGGIVVEKALLERIDAKTGDKISIAIADFPIADVIEKEPDNITNPLTLGPHVLARIQDLDKNELLVPAGLTRFHYHILLNNPAMLEDFKQALAKQFPTASWIVKTSNDNNRGLQNFIDRLQLFMTLAGLSTLLIGGVGIMNASETYLSRQSETIAILKTLGASGNFVFSVYMLILLLITIAGSLTGAVIGSLGSAFALPYLASVLPVYDTTITLDPIAILLATSFGILTVFTFSFGILGKGIGVKPALLFRGMETRHGHLSIAKRLINMLLGAILIALLILTASDTKIATGFIGAAIVSFIVFAIAAAMVKAISRTIHVQKPWARIAIANLHRSGSHTLSIMLSTGIGLTVLIALLLVEGNFQREVEETMPALAPSLFLIDIQPAQKEAFIHYLQSKPYVSDLSYLPMIRGRIAKLKGIPVEQVPIDSDAKWAIESDRGLTFASTPPAGTHITQGQWWQAGYHGKTLVSLDRKLAQGMGLKIGDTMTVNVLGQDIDAQIANLRDVNYISFQINFAMILSPGAIEQFPMTTIATVHVDNDKNEAALVRETATQFPSISSIRIKDSIDQIREIIGHIAVALRLCALVTLFSGILVLASALAATLDKRIYDTIVLKVLGARKADIIKMFLTEWLLLAFITALISCALGAGGAWLIIKRLDWMEFQLIPSAIINTALLALGSITLTGFIIHSRIFNTKASIVLRNE